MIKCLQYTAKLPTKKKTIICFKMSIVPRNTVKELCYIIFKYYVKKEYLRVPTMTQWVNELACLCVVLPVGSSVPQQWVKDLVLPQLWHRLQMQLRFEP